MLRLLVETGKQFEVRHNIDAQEPKKGYTPTAPSSHLPWIPVSLHRVTVLMNPYQLALLTILLGTVKMTSKTSGRHN